MMAWARLDDTLPVHPKVRALTDAAFRLYICAICWSNLHLTDGYVPSSQLRYLSDVRRPAQCAEQLVQAELWENAEGGWRIHDYLEYQPSAEKVRREREAKQHRQERWRSKRDASQDASEDPPQDASSRARAHPIPSHPPDSPVPVISTGSNGQAPEKPDVIFAVQQTIAARTGRIIGDDEARAVATRILGSEAVRNPVAYVTAAINRDPSPGRFLPSRIPTPPPVLQRHPQEADVALRGAAAAREALKAAGVLTETSNPTTGDTP
jgi:hypothetical protein